MAIVDYASLQTAVADELHRLDMAARIPLFVSAAHSDIEQWVKDYTVEAVTDPTTGCISWVRVPYVLTPLVGSADTNDVLAGFPSAYLYGAVARGLIFTRDYQAAQAYQDLYQAELFQLANSDLGLRDGFKARPSTCLGRRPPINGTLSFDQGL